MLVSRPRHLIGPFYFFSSRNAASRSGNGKDASEERHVAFVCIFGATWSFDQSLFSTFFLKGKLGSMYLLGSSGMRGIKAGAVQDLISASAVSAFTLL